MYAPSHRKASRLFRNRMQPGASASGTQLPRRPGDVGLRDRFPMLPTWAPYKWSFFFFSPSIRVSPWGLAIRRERGECWGGSGNVSILVAVMRRRRKLYRIPCKLPPDPASGHPRSRSEPSAGRGHMCPAALQPRSAQWHRPAPGGGACGPGGQSHPAGRARKEGACLLSHMTALRPEGHCTVWPNPPGSPGPR